MITKTPASIRSVVTTLLHIVIMPMFFLGFILVYKSQWMFRFLDTGLGTTFNALMLMCILIGVMCASRIPMTALRKEISLSWWMYSLWAFAEIVVFAAFAALYMALVYYIIFALLMALIRPDEVSVAEEDLVRFADSTGRLKLVIAHDVILYIEAQENYIAIHYLEGELHKEYSLRQSMRGIEELMEKHGIIRCQRSYFVNPRHVKVLRRDKEGLIQAELDVSGIRPVPVSPKYYEDLSKML